MPGPVSDSYPGPTDEPSLVQDALQITTCVWCGHAFPPCTRAWGQKVLYEHAQVCEKHPCHVIAQERDGAMRGAARLREELTATKALLTETKAWAYRLEVAFCEARAKQYEHPANQLSYRPAFDNETAAMLKKIRDA